MRTDHRSKPGKDLSPTEPLASRAERELEALGRLRRERPKVFLVLIASVFVVGAFFLYDHFWGIPGLKERIADQEKEILRLETQLAPFRALALERYSLPEGEALAKLAGNLALLEERLNQYFSKVRQFEVVVEVRVAANWAEEQPPNSTALLRDDRSPVLTVDTKLEDGSIRQILLFATENPHIGPDPAAPDGAIIAYRAAARAGDWIIGSERADLVSTEHVALVTWGLERSVVSDGRVRVREISLVFFVNGERAHVIEKRSDQELVLPESPQGFSTLQWTESEPFGSGI